MTPAQDNSTPLTGAARIGDVARAAGVSTATVSRTLTYPERVRAETRQKVLDAVRRLDYTPNEAARVLRAGASRMILVQIPHRFGGAFFPGVLSGIDEQLAKHGYTMIMGSLDDSENKARRLIDLVFAGQLDGIILLTGHVPAIGGRSMLDAGIPIVSICAELRDRQSPSVLLNDEDCAVLQTQHLLDLGHRRLMYVAGIPNNYNEVHRYRGFCKTLAKAGLDPIEAPRYEGDYTLASGAAAARAFLTLKPRPTGIVCCSDEMAIGFIKVITDVGLSCPRDVSIVGFDGIEFADYCEPTLTTIWQPRAELGASGARLLIDALSGKPIAADTRIMHRGDLRVRASTSPIW